MTDFTKLNEFPIEDVYKTIADLENTNFGSTDFGDIKKKVDLLIRCGFMMVEVPEGKIIYRGRLWDIEKDKVYTSRSEISFPPIAKSGSFSLNRASSNLFQVFYGAVGTPDMEAAEVVALTEICHITEDDFPDGTFEYVVIGQWIVKKPFVVASLGLHSDMAKANQQAQDMLKFHDEACGALDERGKAVEAVGKFLSREFSKKVQTEREYMISAAYGDILFQRGIGGILFPSVKADGKTFNVALRNDLVDDCLELRVAAIPRSQKFGKQVIVDWYLQSPTIVGGKLKWEEPDTGTISSYERKIIESRIKAGKPIN
jgi:hypothetical protein